MWKVGCRALSVSFGMLCSHGASSTLFFETIVKYYLGEVLGCYVIFGPFINDKTILVMPCIFLDCALAYCRVISAVIAYRCLSAKGILSCV